MANQARPEIVVAAASNLTDVFRKVGPAFEAETGIHPVFSFGSTAELEQQAEHGAPFDVFAAADVEHVDQLQRRGLLAAGSMRIYARGALALWIPAGDRLGVKKIKDLALPDVRVIAVAKPELAPYGQAAVDALMRSGLWARVSSKIVYAENINMAKQYGVSGNADAVFTAYPLVLHEKGAIVRVDESLHPPIDQALGVMAASTHSQAALLFVGYLLRGHGRDMLAEYGYLSPNH